MEMIEGKLYYDEQKDYWYIIKECGNKVKVSDLIYALSSLSGYFDDELYAGEGEYFRVTMEVIQ